jgi:hypothetical protein
MIAGEFDASWSGPAMPACAPRLSSRAGRGSDPRLAAVA